jgi:streptogramin lyase
LEAAQPAGGTAGAAGHGGGAGRSTVDAGADASFGGRAFVEFPVPTTGAGPNDITTGPDGNLWFTEQNANAIGRLSL